MRSWNSGWDHGTPSPWPAQHPPPRSLRCQEPEAMLPVNVEESHICVGDRFSVFFLRTLRVPEDGRTYPLPPGLGEFPIHWVEDYTGSVPPDWRAKGVVFIPLCRRGALGGGGEAPKGQNNT